MLQLHAEQVIAFAVGTPPARLGRIDWRSDRELRDLVGQPAPDVQPIPAIVLPDWLPSTKPAGTATSTGALGRDY